MPQVREIHVVCRQGLNVENVTDTHFDTGYWVIAHQHARTDGTVIIALHADKLQPSYLQGVIEELLSSESDERIMVRVRKTPDALLWKGGGSGERGYLWEGGDFSNLPVVPILMSRWLKAGANESYRCLLESADWAYPTHEELMPDASPKTSQQDKFEDLLNKISAALDSPEIPYAFNDAAGTPYRLDNRRIRFSIGSGVFDRPTGEHTAQITSVVLSSKTWEAKVSLRKSLRDLVFVGQETEAAEAHPPQSSGDATLDAFSGVSIDAIDTSTVREELRTSVTVRLGQPLFRETVGEAYGWRCAITNTGARDTLQAAHIVPYETLGDTGNHVQNGILLRADIHLLFDSGLIGLRYDSDKKLRVAVARELADTHYARFAGSRPNVPRNPACRPSQICVTRRFEIDFAGRESIEEKSNRRKVVHFMVPAPLAEDVIPHLGRGEAHWKARHSAYELAHSWQASGGFPPAIASVLATDPELRKLKFLDGLFERAVDLSTPGAPSQTDLMVLATNEHGLCVIAIEGKAREPFGDLVQEWNKTTGTQRRLQSLAATLTLAPEACGNLRYQLLHRTCSAIYEAQRYMARSALMIVHSFSPNNESFVDFARFAIALNMPVEECNKLSAPREFGGVTLRIGWASDLPRE